MAGNGCARSSSLLDAFILSGSSSPFVGTRSMLSFEDVRPCNRAARSFDGDENGDEELEEYFQQPGKKRRLTGEQVQFLEKSFEVENKLEPDRKVQLAKDLGLQPRQVAIWFQNRRARWKAKQLEKDYVVLLASYNSLKTGYDGLVDENEKLKTEVNVLTSKLLAKSSVELPKTDIGGCKPEEMSSGKSDIFDSDSPRYTDGVQSLLETGDASNVFEQEQSDLSQDEDDNLNKSILNVGSILPKVEDGMYFVNHTGFEDPSSWSWSYLN